MGGINILSPLWHAGALCCPSHHPSLPADGLVFCHCQVRWAMHTCCHTKHIWLTPSGLTHLPRVGRKDNWVHLMSLTFCRSSGWKICQAAELKYQSSSDNLPIWFLFAFLCWITIRSHNVTFKGSLTLVQYGKPLCTLHACRLALHKYRWRCRWHQGCLYFSKTYDIMPQFLRNFEKEKTI